MKKLTAILCALLMTLTAINPTVIFAEDEANNEQITNQEVIQEESVEPVTNELTETNEPMATTDSEETNVPTETSEPEEAELLEVEVDQANSTELQSISTANITIRVNIDVATITLTENGQDTDIQVLDGIATAMCTSSCVVEIDGSDATLKTATQNNQIIYTLSEPYQNKITMNFDDSPNQTAEVTFGYKLTVTTHYLTTTGPNVDENGGIKWNSVVTIQKMLDYAVDAPTIYTKVLEPGEAMEMYPLPSTSGDYPLSLLDYQGIVVSNNARNLIVSRKAKSGAMASDDPEVWFTQSQVDGITTTNTRYFALKAMPVGDVSVDYAYNYTKKAFFVGLAFEQVDGTYKNEEFNGSHGAFPSYHFVDFVIDGKEQISFDPKESIFGDSIIFPDGKDKSDYTLKQVYVLADSNFAGYIYYNKWNDSNNTIGSNNMKAISGLSFAKDGSGKIDGIFKQRLENRNYIMTYYFQLNRSLVYNANNGTNVTDSEVVFAKQEVMIKDNMFIKDGYTFNGWNTQADGNGTSYEPNANLIIPNVDEFILYAQWVANATPTPVPPTPTPTPIPPTNLGCPEGTTWDEDRQQCLAPVVVPVQPINPQPQQPEEEVIVDEQTPEQGNQQVTAPTPTPEEKIIDDTTPEVVGRKSWALINLIAGLLGLLLAIFLIFSKREKEEIEEQDTEEKEVFFERKGIYKWISGIIAAVSILVFIFTENMRLPMRLVDRYTILMLVFLLINAVAFYFGRRWHENQEEEETQQ